MGFQTGLNGVAVDIFCACTGGKVGPIFVSPTSTTSFTFTVPTKAMGLNTGPGSFVISNMGADAKYSKKSNAVAASIGARVQVFSVVQSKDYASITVNGTGFSALTVINLFNNQGGKVVNLGGLGSDGKPGSPLLCSMTRSHFRNTGSFRWSGLCAGGQSAVRSVQQFRR